MNITRREPHPLDALDADTHVRAASARAREACEKLRWHPALRRRAENVAVEARVHAAHSWAKLDGSGVPLDHVRLMTAGEPAPGDASGELAAAAVRACHEAQHLAGRGGAVLAQTPRQALARLHTAAAAGRMDADTVGRPRVAAEAVVDDQVPRAQTTDAALRARQDALWQAMSAPPQVSALLVASLTWAETLMMGLFCHNNALVGRAAFRAICVGRGLDPLAVCAPEPVMVEQAGATASALMSYSTGSIDGLRGWVSHCADLIEAGCGISERICQGVLAGRFPS